MITRHELYAKLAKGATNAIPVYYCPHCQCNVEVEQDPRITGTCPVCKVCGSYVTYHYDGVYD